MAETGARGGRGLAPLLLGSVVVVLVTVGQARGLWLANLHNGMLALAFTFVGAYVLYQRPGHREGRLFLAAGVVEALLFFGRQLGHFPTGGTSLWWGWLGVWPTVVALALTTMAVLCFPDGRLPSRAWRWVVAAVVALAALCAALSAGWPVEYSSTGVTSRHLSRTPCLPASRRCGRRWLIRSTPACRSCGSWPWPFAGAGLAHTSGAS